jgi:hypothetical protein
MKTITITLQVPDGTTVQVNQGGQRAASNTPFVERPAPPQPDGYCEIHDMDWQLVPAGVSRTKVDENGNPKRFNAFWTCPQRGCDNRPPRSDNAPQRRSQPALVDISDTDDLPF